MTDIRRYFNDTVKLSPREKLTKSGSAVLELVLSKTFGTFGNIDQLSTVYYCILICLREL